jgi:hypothetical protein
MVENPSLTSHNFPHLDSNINANTATMKVAFIPVAGVILSLGMASANELPICDNSPLKDVNPQPRFKPFALGVFGDGKMHLEDHIVRAVDQQRKALEEYSRAIGEQYECYKKCPLSEARWRECQEQCRTGTMLPNLVRTNALRPLYQLLQPHPPQLMQLLTALRPKNRRKGSKRWG